jgi:WD40 repeat protein
MSSLLLEIRENKISHWELRIKHLNLVMALLPTIIFIAACQTQPNQIFVEVDGTRQTLTTEATTVREALVEANVVLGSQDRVSPDLYVQLESGLTIVVIRVREEIETERKVVPFERQTVVNEALAAGESKIAQLGVNGEDETSIRVVYENGVEVSRTEVSRAVVLEPVPEILVVGPQDTLLPVPVEGTVTYISNGNAWLMRDSSSSRRALTIDGNLDGRVFGLSPDGRQLLYTTELPNEIELPINEMWLASTTIVGEVPITLGIRGVLQAEWSPVVTQSLVAYSTAKRTASPPGWQANNDLWLLTLPATSPGEEDENKISLEPVQLMPPNTAGLYPWWGTSFAWSPDGTQLAYARPDQIGVIDLADVPADASVGDYTIPLVDFPPLQTFSDWAWVPGISWSPDGQFIAAAVHGPPLASEPVEESPVFDLWLISTAGTISAKVAGSVGMWTNPAWGEAGIAFGEAIEPLRSVSSRYTIRLIDKDGSNKHQIFPLREESGVQLPELVWSPDGEELLFIHNGNLHLISHGGGVSKQLSTDGQASHPRWALAQAPIITSTASITTSDTITITEAITSPSDVTSIPSPADILQTPTATPTRRVTGTVTVQPTGTVTTPNSSENP